MDWTSIYVESGEEELTLQSVLPCSKKLRQSRLARLVSVVYSDISAKNGEGFGNESSVKGRIQSKSSGYNLLALYFLSINYILGVGCLGVPYAFAKAGLILGSFLIIIVTLISFITVMWIAESCEMADYLHRNQCSTKSSSSNERNIKNYEDLNERSNLLQRSQSSLEEENRHYEVIELISLFLGPFHHLMYQVSLMGLMYVGLLAYSQVFTGSLSTLLPEDMPFSVSTIIYSVIVIPLSCTELDEQISLQAIMAAIRFLAIFIMVGGSLMSLTLDDSGDGRRDNFPFFAEPVINKMSYTVSFNGFGIAFSTALFSQLFQHSVPGLLKPLKDEKRSIDTENISSKVPTTFAAALLTTALLYLTLGCAAASYFGAATNASINLNFANFEFGRTIFTDSEIDHAFIPARTISSIASNTVVFFPVLDTISVFPLIANTLGNNLLASAGNLSATLPLWIDNHILSFVSDLFTKKSENAFVPTSNTKRMYLAGRVATILFRLIASLPPLFLSLFATDLSFSLQLAGICGLYVAFFAPTLLYMRGKKKNKER